MDASPAPFSCSYSRDVPDILARLGCSLALTTYQAGKVILLSPADDGLIQLARNFHRPMGTAVQGARMAVAAHNEVVILENAPSLAASYPRKPNYYDALFVPRAVYFTGGTDLHDIAWGGETLWAVNTLFSCLCRIDARYSFRPEWKPPFIRELAPVDYCHLNGLAMNADEPLYVTALGATDTSRGWRDNRLTGGVVMHVPTGEIVLDGLAMPHSPRLFDEKLYMLSAARGELLLADPETGTMEVINQVPGFARGLARHGDYLFVGHSHIRKKHIFGDMPVAQNEHYAGIVIVHQPTGRIAAAIRYHASCEEIYDVHVLPGMLRPGILGVDNDVHRQAIFAPHGSYWSAPHGEAVAEPPASPVTDVTP